MPVIIGCIQQYPYALVAINARGRVFFVHMLQQTIRSMARDKAQQRENYRNMIRRVLMHVKPAEIMMEAYVARGFGTTNTEYVNLMLGSLMTWAHMMGIRENATQASSWKNEVNRHYTAEDFVAKIVKQKRTGGLDHLYAYGKERRVPAHLIDALCLATYLRHEKSMRDVDWTAVRKNVDRIRKLMRPEHLLPEKRTKKTS